MHVRLVIKDKQMDVFIDDMDTPILQTNDLKLASAAGQLGFGTFLGAAYYANLSYQKTDSPTLSGNRKPQPEATTGTIRQWRVSQAFAEKDLADLTTIKGFTFKEAKKLNSETTGTINLAQISAVSETTNTVLAKVVIDSDRAQTKRLDFGFSDKVRVFVNDRIVYAGNDPFVSRDYRFLGTIGYFDSVYLDLKEGENEVVFAVSEAMGGWGLQAKLADLDGVKVMD